MNSRRCQNKTGLTRVIIHFILMLLQQGREKSLRTREQCRPRGHPLLVNVLIKKYSLVQSWLFGVLPRDCLRSLVQVSYRQSTVWAITCVPAAATTSALWSSVHMGPLTSVAAGSRFPDGNKIRVVFNLFLSRSWPSVQNWEQVTNVSQRMIKIQGILKKKYLQRKLTE